MSREECSSVSLSPRSVSAKSADFSTPLGRSLGNFPPSATSSSGRSGLSSYGYGSYSYLSERKQFREFLQDGPRLGNQYTEDGALQDYLRTVLPKNFLNSLEDEMKWMGTLASTKLLTMSDAMERNQPVLVQYNGWGERVDFIETCQEWKDMKAISAVEGLVALGYERQHSDDLAEYCRIVQFSKLYLYGPSSGLFTCPLAMTDGASRLLELCIDFNHKQRSSASSSSHSKESDKENRRVVSDVELKELELAFQRLTSRDPEQFWTSGQWMTERSGGSDVGDGTETIARLQSDGSYELFGFKWFTSATDSDMTITLARIVDGDGNPKRGSTGISCFYMRTRDDSGALNRIRIHRLKNKFGTKQLPTAELELCGSRAVLLSRPGRGISLISSLINVTRIYNSVMACGYMRRIIALQRDFMYRRKVFGALLAENSLHCETVAAMQIQLRGALILTLHTAELLGRVESGRTQRGDASLLRLLTPLLKLYTAKQCVSVVSEGLESFGGAGYVEDSKLPRIYRDSQVLPIWEGTTNVLSHDLLRVLTGDKQVMKHYAEAVQRRVSSFNDALKEVCDADRARFASLSDCVSSSMSAVASFISQPLSGGSALHGGAEEWLKSRARDLAFSMTRVYVAALMLGQFGKTRRHLDAVIAERWILDGTTEWMKVMDKSSANFGALVIGSLLGEKKTMEQIERRLEETKQIAMDVDESGNARGVGDKDGVGVIRSKL